jgi:thiol-disulfide isomerase/thioredoxin
MIGPFLVSLLTLVAPGERAVQIGDVPSFTFQRAPRNGVLVRTLEDLRGKPALFEFWGPRCPGCVQVAVPSALKLQETWGDALQVVMVEVQGAGADDAARFALGQRWFGGRAIWTSETPFWPGGRGLPTCVLLGNQGQVLLKGNPLSQTREIERLVAEQVRLRRAPPASTPESLRPAWTEYLRGQIGRASQLARAAEGQHAGDPETLGRLRDGIESLRRGIEARFAAVAALLDAGLVEEAEARLDDLKTGARDDPALEERAADLARRLASDEVRAEREASRQLGRLLSRYFESGGDAAVARDLERFAEREAGTKSAARAADWARLAPAKNR